MTQTNYEYLVISGLPAPHPGWTVMGTANVQGTQQALQIALYGGNGDILIKVYDQAVISKWVRGQVVYTT